MRHPHPTPEMAQRMANAVRMLAVDAVEAAKSGHPGAPMGMADIAEVLWNRHLQHNPADPHWANRDRFVLSNGHGSMLIYALLHLTGYDLPVSELRKFRQLHSRTPGHPEVDITPGVETTTGPLGQGITNAVGMALAEKMLAAQFNREVSGQRYDIVDHMTYVFLGDGCLMEGISHEACSLAGTWRLSKLVALYDDNGISIDGHVEGWFTDNTPQRFASYGWHVIADVDGHNPAAVDAAIQAAKAQSARPDGRPTLICCKTTIGMGSPNKAGTHDVHGAALGEAEVAATRAALGWPHAAFEIPSDVQQAWDAKARGQAAQTQWNQLFANYQNLFPQDAAEFERRMRGELSADYRQGLQAVFSSVVAKADAVATRKASQNALDALAPLLPEFFGGSADLTGSNLTNFKGCVRAGRDALGNHMSYGVREFGMAAIMNGMALHGGFLPYGGTFLTFSDYSRNAIRMAALMKKRVIHVFTHDSIGLGEDGPTHQSVEHVPSLRIIPGLDVWRPADGLETAVAWACAVERHDGPSALALSRQNLPRVLTDAADAQKVRQGGYVLSDMAGAQAILLATGSEVSLALKAQADLASQGLATRVVSMPCTNVFDRQSESYQEAVLPLGLPTVAIEAAHPDFWRKYVGRQGAVIGIASFGESAPAPALYAHFGITSERVCDAVKKLVCRNVECLQPTTSWRAYLFDLDGTLVETAPEIGDAVNDTMRHFGWPEVSLEDVRRWIGHGTQELLIQAMAKVMRTTVDQVRSGKDLPSALPIFDRCYQERCGTRSSLYPHVKEVLAQLRARGCKLAVVTNKEARYTEIVLRVHQLQDAFDVVVSGDSFAVKKPNPEGALACLRGWGIAPTESLFVGDSSIDAATARNAGLNVWLLPYGYNMGEPVSQCRPDRVIPDFSSLL